MLTHLAHSLPPILHRSLQDSLSSWSKGSRGLSVLLRVNRIFTASSTSLRATPRQRPDRYAIRAGRNLPDKEFRYLRTVIVTAAVYRGFDSKLWPEEPAEPLLLTFRHRAGVTPYTSACNAFAECCVFAKQSPGTFHCNPLRLHGQAASPTTGSPYSEVTDLVCRVP